MNLDHLAWPFFDDAHRRLAADLAAWSAAELGSIEHDDVDATCRDLVRRLGAAGWLRYCVPAADGGALPQLDSRALCIARETLAYADGLADFAFAMQGLGSGPITLAGDAAQRARWLPRVATGDAIAAFALSEPDAGSDVGAMTTRASRDGDGWVLDGTKTWITNGGIADFYCVFARDPATTGTRGISAFVVPAGTRGASRSRNASTRWRRIRSRGSNSTRAGSPANALLGAEGDGFKLAMRTLDVFRASVAAAAIGFARRALDEAVAHARDADDVRRPRRPTCSSRRRRSARWRRRSTRRRCSPTAPRGGATCSGRARRARRRWRR